MGDEIVSASGTMTPLQSLGVSLSTLLARAKATGEKVEGDAAAVLSTLQAALAPFEKQVAALVQGEALTAANKFELFLVAKLHAELPAIIAAAEAAAESEVVALGTKVG